MEKNVSAIPGKHKMSPENESLSRYFDSLSPVSDKLSLDKNEELSIKPDDSGDTGYSGDKIGCIMEVKDYGPDNDVKVNSCVNTSVVLNVKYL